MTLPRYETRRDIWLHLLLYPGHTLPTAAAPVLVGLGLAAHHRCLALWPALAAFLCSWLVHVGGVFADNYQLLTRHPTVREHPELNDAVASQLLRLPVLRAATVAWFVAALVPGLYLLEVIGPPAIALGAVGVAASAWYAIGGRRSMAALGLADPVFFVMFGVVAVAGTYLVQAISAGAEALPLSALLLGLPAAALVTNVLIIDDLRDVDFDARKGWQTTPVRFGAHWSRREHLALTTFAYLAPLALTLRYGPWLLLPMLTLPVAVLAERQVWRATGREQLIPWTPRSAMLSMAYGALFGLGLALSGQG